MGGDDPVSVAVDQLEYRLDDEIIHDGCRGLDLTGSDDATRYGLCIFIQIENLVCSPPLKCSTSTTRRQSARARMTLKPKLSVDKLVVSTAQGLWTPMINSRRTILCTS